MRHARHIAFAVLVAASTVAGSLASASSVSARVSFGVSIGLPLPPPVRAEVITVRPGPAYAWAPGYWRWHSPARSYVWVGGSWVRPLYPRAVWVGPHWGSRWIRGGWR